jgi:hypothetical protein
MIVPSVGPVFCRAANIRPQEVLMRTGPVKILSVLAVALGAAATSWADPILSIEPSSTLILPRGGLSLDVNISGVTDLFAFQFDLSFAPALLADAVVSEGPFLSSAGGSTFFVPGRTMNGGVSAIADTLLGSAPGVSGAGTLATINLTALLSGASGTTTLALSNVLLFDSQLRPIPSTSVPSQVTILPEPRTWTLILVALLGGMLVRTRFSRLRGSVLLIVLVALSLPIQAAAPGYQFKFLVREGDTIAGKTIQRLDLFNLAINNAGLVVFAAAFPGGSGLFTPTSILVATGGTIAGHILQDVAQSHPGFAVNDDGALVFEANLDTSVFTLSQLLAQSGDTFRGKTLRIVYGPYINNAGAVVFGGQFDQFGEDAGIFLDSELLVATGDTIAGKTLTGFGSPVITDTGTVLFVGFFPGGEGIFTPSELLFTLPVKGDVIGGKTLTQDAPGFNININRAGIVTFEATFAGGSGLFTPTEMVFDYSKPIGGQTIVITNGQVTSNAGTIVVRGIIPPIPGITQGSGAGLFKPSELIVASGDTIDGNALSDVDALAINDAGVIVFLGTFLDGSHAIIQATPLSTGVAGDVNGDGVVDCADLDFVRVSLGTRYGQAGFDPQADINGDGVVDLRDLALVAQKVPQSITCP